MGYDRARLEHAYKVFRPACTALKHIGSYISEPRQHARGRSRGLSHIRVKQIATSWHDKDQEISDGEWSPSETKRRRRISNGKVAPARKRTSEGSVQNEKVGCKNRIEPPNPRSGTEITTLRLTSVKARNRLAVFRYLDTTDPTLSSEPERADGPKCMFEALGGSFDQKEANLNVFLDDSLIGSFEERILRSGKASSRFLSCGKEHKSEHVENVHRDEHGWRSTSPGLEAVNDIEETVSMQRNGGLGFPAPRVKSSVDGLSPPGTPMRQIASLQPVSAVSCVTTITTHYAHPIDFHHMPTPSHPCDFCSDYRMGILGLGRKTVSAFVEDTDPARYQELGDGHRASGRDVTRMCKTCAHKRLDMTMCHSVEQQQVCAEQREEGELIAQFSKIPGVSYSQQELQDYMSDLFQHTPRDGRNIQNSNTGQIPACSLCPAPAWWQCCRRRVVEATEYAETSSRCASPAPPPIIQCLSPFSSFSPAKMDNTERDARSLTHCTEMSSQIVGSLCHELLDPADSIVPSVFDFRLHEGVENCSQIMKDDGDDSEGSDDDLMEITAEAFYSVQPGRSLCASPFEHCEGMAARLDNSTSSAPGLVFPFNIGSRNASQVFTTGCGLKLCNPCKTFLERDCNGVLRKRKIMRMLTQENKFGARADTEFLFEDGLLAEAYRQERAGR